MTTPFHTAVATGDLDAVSSTLERGQDVNALCDGVRKRALSIAISGIEDVVTRHAMLKLLLSAGADPRLLDDADERLGPLFQAVLLQDAGALELLLNAGANPNGELGTEGESLYDWAQFDYRYENNWVSGECEAPTEGDKATEETWLAYLDRMAEKYGKAPPDHLRLLRSRGALSITELKPRQQDDA